MLDIIRARIFQRHRTMQFPDGPPPKLSDRFAGRPNISRHYWNDNSINTCISTCPTGAMSRNPDGNCIQLDLGKCIFCRQCEKINHKGISFSENHKLASTRRENLIIGGNSTPLDENRPDSLFKKSLKLRQVSAGGCNACEADTNVLSTLAWDLGRFGIQFVASPRHADGILVTGPVTENMKSALLKTYEAVPSPKIVIALGACAISGGPFINHQETNNGVADILPVDMFIPGCPPHPLTILDALLHFTGRITD